MLLQCCCDRLFNRFCMLARRKISKAHVQYAIYHPLPVEMQPSNNTTSRQALKQTRLLKTTIFRKTIRQMPYEIRLPGHQCKLHLQQLPCSTFCLHVWCVCPTVHRHDSTLFRAVLQLPATRRAISCWHRTIPCTIGGRQEEQEDPEPLTKPPSKEPFLSGCNKRMKQRSRPASVIPPLASRCNNTITWESNLDAENMIASKDYLQQKRTSCTPKPMRC